MEHSQITLNALDSAKEKYLQDIVNCYGASYKNINEYFGCMVEEFLEIQKSFCEMQAYYQEFFYDYSTQRMIEQMSEAKYDEYMETMKNKADNLLLEVLDFISVLEKQLKGGKV